MNKSIFRIWNKLILSIFIFSFLHSAFCKPVNLSKIVYGDNQFVAIGWIGSYVKKTMRSIILTSTNGITWTKQNFETNQFLNGIVYGDKKFVAVGGYGTIITSSDGIHWSKQKIPILKILDFPTRHYGISAIAYGNNKFVAVVGFGKVLISSNSGITWIGYNIKTSSIFYGITYGDNQFVAVGDLWPRSGSSIFSSTKGIIWTKKYSGRNNNILWGITYGDGKFVAVGKHSTILTSSNGGITWTKQNFGIKPGRCGSKTYLWGITYGDKKFVAVGGGIVLTSSNGINWKEIKFPQTSFSGITYGDGKFVAVGMGYNTTTHHRCGIIITSQNEKIWKSIYITSHDISKLK